MFLRAATGLERILPATTDIDVKSLLCNTLGSAFLGVGCFEGVRTIELARRLTGLLAP
jgi:hypothetical protein